MLSPSVPLAAFASPPSILIKKDTDSHRSLPSLSRIISTAAQLSSAGYRLMPSLFN